MSGKEFDRGEAVVLDSHRDCFCNTAEELDCGELPRETLDTRQKLDCSALPSTVRLQVDGTGQGRSKVQNNILRTFSRIYVGRPLETLSSRRTDRDKTCTPADAAKESVQSSRLLVDRPSSVCRKQTTVSSGLLIAKTRQISVAV
uniref:Uncharacterized protein n=1 Tax=Steinernema glaseri TaxID=37863 RepID=A0A1I8A6F7_9BILA